MKNRPIRIGIILTSLGGLDTKALKYLVLFQNTLQESFEFQFLPTPENNNFLKQFDSPEPVDREAVEKKTGKFVRGYTDWLKRTAGGYELTYEPPDAFALISTARFSDNYYTTNKDDLHIIALGLWQRHMAPPSIVEFFLTLLVGIAIDTACGDNFPPCHNAIKGCVSDFAADMDDARWTVLTGFLCESCCAKIEQSRSRKAVADAKLLLGKKWLGDATNPTDAATTAKKLGYDLFHTKGVKQTFWERLSATIQEEAIKNLLKVVGGIILAALLIWLGLKDR